MQSALVDGFIVYCTTEDDPRLQAIYDRNLPFVLVDYEPGAGPPHRRHRRSRRRARDRGAPASRSATGGSGRHRRRDDGAEPTGRAEQAAAVRYVEVERLKGWGDALDAAGIDWGAVPIGTATDFVRETGRRAAATLLDRADRPTAIIALSDELALGVLDAAAERGIAVPGDISVAGFDDIAEAALTIPEAHHRPPAARPQGLRSRAPAAGGRRERVRPPPHRARRPSLDRSPKGVLPMNGQSIAIQMATQSTRRHMHEPPRKPKPRLRRSSQSLS